MNSNEKVLILGSTGFLGACLRQFLALCDYEIYSHGFSNKAEYNADLTILDEADQLLKKINPSLIINLVAETNVDLCEINPNKAFLLNIKSVENLVKSIQKNNMKTHVIHISTDQLYDSMIPSDEDNISLKNYYAYSKYSSELIIKNVSSTILRTNFFGKSNIKKGFTEWIYNSLTNNKHIFAFDDIYFNPLSILTLNKCILFFINSKLKGTFNLGSRNGMSKSDFIFYFSEKLNLPLGLINKISSKDFNDLKAYRPKGMIMNIKKFEDYSKIKLPSLEDEIETVVKEYFYD